MRTTIVAIGSTGDVAPLLGVARHLADVGHDVRFATHRSARVWVEATGLEFGELPTEPEEMMTEELAARLRRGGLSAARAVAAAFAPSARPLIERIDSLADDCDVMLTSLLAWPGLYSADVRGIPAMALHLQPLHPTAELAPFPLGVRSLGGPLNRALGRAVQAGTVRPCLGLVDEIRAAHGKAQWSARQHLEFVTSRVPVLHGFSPQVLPRPHDWRAGLDVVGYWSPPPRPGWSPSPELVDFVEAGPPPVYIGFGSSRPAPADELGRLVTAAVRAAKVRAVVDVGWAGLRVEDDGVLCIAGADHRWLFPRMAAVVHHGGAGTSGAAVLSGVPSVPVPVSHDQPLWARRLHALGVATAPVRARRLSGSALAAAIGQATSDGALHQRATALATRVAAEHGLASVAAAVGGLAQ